MCFTVAFTTQEIASTSSCVVVVGYKKKVYQSCLLTVACDGTDVELIGSFAKHLQSERVGVSCITVE